MLLTHEGVSRGYEVGFQSILIPGAGFLYCIAVWIYILIWI